MDKEPLLWVVYFNEVQAVQYTVFYLFILFLIGELYIPFPLEILGSDNNEGTRL